MSSALAVTGTVEAMSGRTSCNKKLVEPGGRVRKTRRRNSAQGAKQATRLVTGIPGFDEIVGGGLIPRRFYIVEGEPGTGKTTFASQLAFNRARAGERCVYVTMLSETNAALLENLRTPRR